MKTSIPLDLQEKIFSLKEGQSFSEKILSSNSLETFRNQIYSFLHQKGIKIFYRVYREGDILKIKRLQTLSRQPIGEDFGKVSNFVSDKLFDIEDEEEAKNLILSAIENKILDETNFFPAFNEWKEKILCDKNSTEEDKFEERFKTLEKALNQDQKKGEPK